jgi:hypothetical protein
MSWMTIGLGNRFTRLQEAQGDAPHHKGQLAAPKTRHWPPQRSITPEVFPFTAVSETGWMAPATAASERACVCKRCSNHITKVCRA